jgi:pimeloyl-ACP methyl ester carboxylesterase
MREPVDARGRRRCHDPVTATFPLHVERDNGGAPGIVLLHGLGASGRYWRRVREHLQGRRVAVPDLLGFGRSPNPDTIDYDLEDHLSGLRPLVGAGDVVVGHSTGAILAAALAADPDVRVGGVVLVGAPAFPDEATARAEIGRLGRLARWTVEDRRSAAWVCAAMCHLRPLAIAVGPWLKRDLPREIVQDGFRHTWPSYSGTLRNVVVAHRLEPDLAEASGPVVFIHGENDTVAPLPHVISLVERHPSFDLARGPGDHHLPLRHAARVARLIQRAAERT